MKVVFIMLVFVANYSRTSLQLSHSSEIGALQAIFISFLKLSLVPSNV